MYNNVMLFFAFFGVFGFGTWVFAKKFSGGEFDNIIIAIHNVGSAGKFDGGKAVTNGKSDFFGKETSVRCNDTGADDAVVFVGDEFDKAVVEIVSFTGNGFVEIYYGFFVFAVAADEVIFGETDNSYLGLSVGDAGKAAVVRGCFGASNEVSS